VRIGTLELGNLKPKEWRNLTQSEVRSLKRLADAEKTQRPRQRTSRPGTKSLGSKPQGKERPSRPGAKKPFQPNRKESGRSQPSRRREK
jgi:hypothetical protein